MPGQTALKVDRFDEPRRAWIASHQGWSTIQRRRAELLGRRVRAQQRTIASAVPDPHDDTILPPLLLRTATSPGSRIELVIVMLAAILAPVGWLLGWSVKHVVTALIPGTLRGYPIAALLWSGVVLGSLIALLYDPAGDMFSLIALPWVCLQVATVPVVAGLYGIAEGWLAIPGSTQWWPLTPPRPPVTADDAAAVLGSYDLIGPGLLDAQRLNESGERSRP
jgi:hypothetical protein